MASYLSAADIISTAVEIEKRGREFYLKAAEQATKPEDKELFQFLAEEESKHKKIFSSMLERIGGAEIPAGASDDEYLMYVQGLIDSHCLFTKDKIEGTIENPLMQAIQFEKDTMIFFEATKSLVPEGEQKHIKACADEERKHLLLLIKKMNKDS